MHSLTMYVWVLIRHANQSSNAHQSSTATTCKVSQRLHKGIVCALPVLGYSVIDQFTSVCSHPSTQLFKVGLKPTSIAVLGHSTARQSQVLAPLQPSSPHVPKGTASPWARPQSKKHQTHVAA